MKRKLLLAAACLMLLVLTACQSSTAETCWKAAQKAGGLEDYVKEQAENIDMEALKQEAAEGKLDQQFKATALLCALEYQLDRADEATPAIPRFQFDYPVSSAYASQFLNRVNTEGEAFWLSMKDAFSPYDCYLPIFAAAKDLDGPTLVKLLEGAPEDKAKFRDAVDKWIEQNPGRIIDVGSALTEYGYFEDWDLTEWNPVFVRPETNQIRTDTAEDAFRYVAYLRDVVIPPLASKYGTDTYMETSEVTGEEYFSHPVMVSIQKEGLSLQAPGDALPETIDIAGKTVVAFYRNPTAGNFEDYLPELQLMGGFLLALPPEEVPATLAEADYYLVLTADFQTGDFYQTYGGSSTGIQQVASRTSVDLYDAASGTFLRHLGTVLETPPDTVYANYGEESLRYPVATPSDVLTYLYHHINEPDAYVSLVDHTPVNGSELAKDEPVIFGNWEITYHSAKIVKEFESGYFIYTAKDGHQFVMADLTVTNRGLQSDTFLPMLYYINEDPIVQIADSSRENLYDCVDALSYSACLNGNTLDPSESKDGVVLFEIPDELVQSGEALYLAVSLDKQIVYYPLF